MLRTPAAASASVSQTSIIRFLAISLVAGTIAAYWPLRHNDFVNYDDQQYITENPHVQHGFDRQSLSWAFTTSHASNWHPLTWLSHMMDCRLFGLNPQAHHLVNLALHVANTLLVFLLLLQLTNAPLRSGFVATLFAIHPLHVESVAWASERKDVLSAFFGLSALIAYTRYALIQRPARALETAGRNAVEKEPIARTSHRAAWYWAAFACFALGLMAKPMLVTLPFVMLLFDFWPLGRMAEKNSPEKMLMFRRLIVEKLPFLVVAAASCVITSLVQKRAMVYYKALPVEYRVENAIISYVRYLGKTLWPHNLAVVYPHPGIWPAVQIIGAALFLMLISGLAFLKRRQRPFFFVGWFWFIGMLVPVIGLIQVGVQSMADRYTYLPSCGLFLIFAWVGAEALERLGWPSWARISLAALLVVVCGGLTRLQTGYWRDTETLFSHALQATKGNWVAHHNLALLALNRYQETQRHSLESQALVPQPTSGSRADTQTRDYLAEVISHCDAALEVKPGLAEIHVTLAKALTEKGYLERARMHLQTVISLSPTNSMARQNLAEILHRVGKAKEAVAEYKAVLALEPDWEPVLNNLAWLLATHPDSSVRDGNEAVRLALKASRITGETNLWFLHTLAASYAEQGNFTNAISTAEKALGIARAFGQSNLIRTAEGRVQLYQTHQPLRDPP